MLIGVLLVISCIIIVLTFGGRADVSMMYFDADVEFVEESEEMFEVETDEFVDPSEDASTVGLAKGDSIDDLRAATKAVDPVNINTAQSIYDSIKAGKL